MSMETLNVFNFLMEKKMPKKATRKRIFKFKGKKKKLKCDGSTEDGIDQGADVYNEDVQCDKVNLTF
jgi:hypothetical protein